MTLSINLSSSQKERKTKIILKNVTPLHPFYCSFPLFLFMMIILLHLYTFSLLYLITCECALCCFEEKEANRQKMRRNKQKR